MTAGYEYAGDEGDGGGDHSEDCVAADDAGGTNADGDDDDDDINGNADDDADDEDNDPMHGTYGANERNEN